MACTSAVPSIASSNNIYDSSYDISQLLFHIYLLLFFSSLPPLPSDTFPQAACWIELLPRPN